MTIADATLAIEDDEPCSEPSPATSSTRSKRAKWPGSRSGRRPSVRCESDRCHAVRAARGGRYESGKDRSDCIANALGRLRRRVAARFPLSRRTSAERVGLRKPSSGPPGGAMDNAVSKFPRSTAACRWRDLCRRSNRSAFCHHFGGRVHPLPVRRRIANFRGLRRARREDLRYFGQRPHRSFSRKRASHLELQDSGERDGVVTVDCQ